eukprot:358289-Chlamydomonas_euryale.AAC.2
MPSASPPTPSDGLMSIHMTTAARTTCRYDASCRSHAICACLMRSMRPAWPLRPAEAMRLAGHMQPAESMRPAGPMQPAWPMRPAGPMRLAGHMQPAEPMRPAGPI